jgi:hypothetical protein
VGLPAQLTFAPGSGSPLTSEAFGAELFREPKQLLGLDALAGRGEAPLLPHAIAARQRHSGGQAGPGAGAEGLAGALIEEAGAVSEVGEFAKFEAIDAVHPLGVAGEDQERAAAAEGADAGHHRTACGLDRGREDPAGNSGGCPLAEDVVPQGRFPLPVVGARLAHALSCGH